MTVIEVEGMRLAYEVIGDGRRPWVITPGGRFSKDTPGVSQLAAELAHHDGRVLIWDRPNTGASDVCFAGTSESEMQADALAGLLRSLDMGPAIIVGGSGGSRVSLLTAARHPDVAAGLAVLWITGGVYGLMQLAIVYCGPSIQAAWRGGMQEVVELPEWAEVQERNPRNRQLLLDQDPRRFIERLEEWMLAYVPNPRQTVPGLDDHDYGALTLPSLVFRSGMSDPHHTRATSEKVQSLLPNSALAEPPWGDTEWNQRTDAAQQGTGTLFERWPLLAPQLLRVRRHRSGAGQVDHPRGRRSRLSTEHVTPMDGGAIDEGAYRLSGDEALAVYRTLVTIRVTEERIIRGLNSGELRMTYYNVRGQEAIPAAIGGRLRPDDYMVTTYRGIHDCIAKGVPLDELLAEMCGKRTPAPRREREAPCTSPTPIRA